MLKELIINKNIEKLVIEYKKTRKLEINNTFMKEKK